MPREIAAAVVVMFLGLMALSSSADDNFLEIMLFKKRVDSTDEYSVFIDFNKVGATTCKLTTPSGTSDCPFGLNPTLGGLIREDLSFTDLTNEIGTGTGPDWTLTWDENMTATETVVTIDFGEVLESDWMLLPTITNPLAGATGVPPDTSIDWTWPSEPDPDNPVVQLFGPNNELREPPEEIPIDQTSWTPLSPLAPGDWVAVVANSNHIREVPEGLSITRGTWVLENDEWLAADSIDQVTFDVSEPPCDEGTDSDGDGIADHCECGDISGDGLVNTIDARLIQRCAVGEDLPGICESPLCDVTGEGDCNTIDARLVQRFAVGELTKADLHCSARDGDGLASLSAAACGHGFEAALVVPPLVLIGGRMRRRRR